jgi:tetratricopeptide (TPR) repeat protein
MAASLSVAATGGLPIRGTRAARRIIDRANFRPIELSELESELGTLELGVGADRKARVLFERSLTSPTDNSLAQGAWASYRLPSLDVRIDTLDVPFADEAMSRSALHDGDWNAALDHSIQWLDDQPFDSQAATHASYIAAVGLDDWPTSKLLAEMGLRANPSDPTLLNNMAYALIEMGELDDAEELLRRGRQRGGEDMERVALNATAGLLYFRRGDAAEGRRLYGLAIDRARRAGENDREAMAQAMLLREEILLGIEDVQGSLEAVLRLGTRIQDRGVLRTMERSLGLAGRTGYRVSD